MRISKSFLLNGALVIFSIAIAVGAGEWYFRTFMDVPMYTRFVAEEDKDGIESQGIPDQGFYESTPLGKRLKVNVEGVIRNHNLTGTDIPIRTNKYGFRGPEIVSDDRHRVLFLGDSVTLGDYLVEENTFVALVGEMSKSTPYAMQTINAGVGSIGIEEELNILREHGYKVDPDLVILNLYLNDIQASPAMILKPIPWGLRWSRMAQHYYQAMSVKEYENDPNRSTWIPTEVEESWKAQAAQKYPPGPGDWKVDRAAYNQMMIDWFGDWGASYSEGGVERMTRIAKEIVDLAAEIGAETYVVIHPTIFQVEAEFNPNEPQIEFIKYFNEIGVPVHDLLPALRTSWQNNPNVPLFYDHCHHSIPGAALVASEIFNFILSEKLKKQEQK